jgi:suppressor of ftsI
MRRRAVLAAVLLVTAAGADGAPVPFANPPEVASSGGVLDATLTIAPATVTVAGKPVTLTLYDGLYMPPVLRVQPGDRVRLWLQNGGADGANVHYHGFQVTPLAPGDDVFLDVAPGAAFLYDFALPADHPPGLYWYHPHVHPGVNRDIAGGLSGALVVGDLLGRLGLPGIAERSRIRTRPGPPSGR